MRFKHRIHPGHKRLQGPTLPRRRVLAQFGAPLRRHMQGLYGLFAGGVLLHTLP